MSNRNGYRRPPDPPPQPPTINTDPSWGPIGSLLRQHDPARYLVVLKQHETMVAMERAKRKALQNPIV